MREQRRGQFLVARLSSSPLIAQDGLEQRQHSTENFLSKASALRRYLRPHCLLGLYLLLFRLLPRICGLQVNVTIDDQYGDPSTGQIIQYNPPEAWSIGQDCAKCSAKPRPISNAYRSTWMDASYFRSGRGGVSGQLVTASVPFIGSAVYVQVILTGSPNFPVGNSDFTFYIDNVEVGTFQKLADGDTSYQWNQTVFSKNNLSNSLHTLIIEVGRSDNESLFLLDSIIYTKELTDNTNSNSAVPTGTSASSAVDSSSGSTNIGIIVGPVVGGVSAVLVLLAFLFFMKRRRQGQQDRIPLNLPAMQSIPPSSAGSSVIPGRSNLPTGHIDPFFSPISSGTPCQDSSSSGMNASEWKNAGALGVATESCTDFVPSSSQLPTICADHRSAGAGKTQHRPAAPHTAPPAYSDVAGSRSRRAIPSGERTIRVLPSRQ
ncbi:hypothetical protein ACEPAI_5492 [Sanghuangporus weigelae]